jgi:hypothetical protein
MNKPKKTNIPKPSERDLLDAVEHASGSAAGLLLFLNDFSLRFLGNLLEQISD